MNLSLVAAGFLLLVLLFTVIAKLINDTGWVASFVLSVIGIVVVTTVITVFIVSLVLILRGIGISA